MGRLVLEAHARLGELLKQIERKYVGSIEGTDVPKQIKTLPEGIIKRESHRAQKIAKYRDLPYFYANIFLDFVLEYIRMQT